jgi:integrase
MPLAEIRPRHVAEWAAKAKGGASTVSRDLAILHAIFDSAEHQELIGSNPAKRIERPRQPRRRWRLLEPSEVPAVSKAFTDARARRVFLTLLLTGLRRSELQALRWGHVNLLEATLRVVESKSEEGERLIALPPMLVQVLSEQYAATPYKADTDYVFAHPERGTSLGLKWYAEEFTKTLAAVGITDWIRPFHDMRHTALTNLAATGASPIAVMATAGHRSMQTTKRYLHLAGVAFSEDAAALERRMLGARTTASRAELSTEPSTRLSPSEPTSDDPAPHETAVQASADHARLM